MTPWQWEHISAPFSHPCTPWNGSLSTLLAFSFSHLYSVQDLRASAEAGHSQGHFFPSVLTGNTLPDTPKDLPQYGLAISQPLGAVIVSE